MSDPGDPERGRKGRDRLTAAAGLLLAAAVGMSFVYAMHRARRAHVDALWAEALEGHEQAIAGERRVVAPTDARPLAPEHVLHHVRGTSAGDWFAASATARR